MKKAVKINLFDFTTTPMRTFHMTWFAFFLCFFGWFGVAPLMPLIRDELGLTKSQIGNTIIASVAITVIVRLLIGWLCDRIGPRKAYTGLLILGSIPVMSIGFAQSYETFLLFRLAIGAIGASFVITQYHTSVMFAPNCVGAANATTAGWGNLGGGVTQMVMPLILTVVVGLGVGTFWGWRLAMVIPGVALFLMGFAYFFLTKDFPGGNIGDPGMPTQFETKAKAKGTFRSAIKDVRVWALFVIYGMCFGVELTINNIAALYYVDNFNLTLTKAGLIAGLFGLMNIFARTMGGIFSDKIASNKGIKGRVLFLGITLFVEGIALMVFSKMTILPIAIGTMIVFSLFVQMAEGATFAIVPFVNKKALGAVAGIVGAGGNAGAVMIGFLLKSEGLSYAQALFVLGGVVMVSSALTLVVRFCPKSEEKINASFTKACEERQRIKNLEPVLN
ncbi:MAG: NNP family nitrate/nitrite transporter-like MFS transporter [Lysobacterales bacterium]|jgi:NNP family nitrate/nitrite transporter-like MFS transporter